MNSQKYAFRFDFMAQRKLAMLFSGVLLLASIAGLATQKLNFGIDFTGGVLVEIGYPESVELAEVRQQLEESGFEEVTLQHFGNSKDVMIRLPAGDVTSDELSNEIFNILSAEEPKLLMRRVEFVGPQVGEELTEQGGLALLYALFGILVYVAFRFEYRFALGSVAALIHDVVITLGCFSIFQWDFDLSVLAALLAVIGYSLNDTIVVFDRLRENFLSLRKMDRYELANVSINQTLSRTLMTSVTTLLVLVALFFLGGEVIHNFALALIIGVAVGTYSSIYVASTSALALGVSKEDLQAPQKIDEERLKGEV